MSRVKPSRHRPCQVCRHPDRLRIELLRLSGLSLDRVAARFGVHRDAVHRHMLSLDGAERAALISDLPLRELIRQAAEEGASVMDYLGVLRSVLMKQLLLAADGGDRVGTASLSGRVLETLKELGRITGEISSLTSMTQVTNTSVFINSPIFNELQRMLLERLAPHPQALAAVVEGLRELEGRTDGPTPGQRSPPIAVIEARPS